MTMLENGFAPSEPDLNEGQQHKLDLNGLDLIAGTGDEGWMVEALADETQFGNPEEIVTEVLSQLLDGSLASVDTYDNREAVINVALTGADGNALAAGEAALIAAARGVEGRGLLTWTPPAAGAESAVFEVVYAHVDRTPFEDQLETQEMGPERRYQLMLECRPFARSVEPVEVEGLPAPSGGETITISDGSSTDGWSTTNTQRLRHNVIPDPNFEGTEVTGWSAGAGTAYVELRANPGGGQSLRARNSGTGRQYANSVSLTLQPTRRYSFEIMLSFNYAQGGTSRTARAGVLLRWFDVDQNRIGADVTLGTTAVTANQWRSMFARGLTAPTDAVYARVYPYLDSNGAKVRDLFIDRVALTEHLAPRENSSDSGVYFAGNTTDTPVIDYSWDGATHASTSTATYLPSTLTTDGDAVTTTAYGYTDVTLNYTGDLVPTTESPYLRVSGSASWNVAAPRTDQITMAFWFDDQRTYPDLLKFSDGSFDAAFYRTEAASTIQVRALCPNDSFDLGGTVSVANIELADAPTESTGRQTFRTFPVYGSMRTEADIRLASTTPLGGQTLVYTAPTDKGVASPNLRQWRVSGGEIFAEPDRISGSREPMPTTEATAITFEIPADQIRRGTHAFYANLAMTTTGDKLIRWSATTTTKYTSYREAGEMWTDLSGSYSIVPIAHVTLPPSDVGPAAEAKVVLKLWANTGALVQFDEGWVFNVDDGQVSLIDTSGGVSMVELTSATIDYPNPACWIGDSDTEVNTIHAGSRATFDQHRFPPGDVSVFTAALSSQVAVASLSYFPRWHTHPSVIVLGQTNEDLLDEDGDSSDEGMDEGADESGDGVYA